MFTQEEFKNAIVLMKRGVKASDMTGTDMIIVGALMKKFEDLAVAKEEIKPEEIKAKEIPIKKQKNP